MPFPSYNDAENARAIAAARRGLGMSGTSGIEELPGVSFEDENTRAIAAVRRSMSQEGIAPRRQPIPEAERGFWGDVASHTARGLVSLAEHGAQGLKTITGGAAGGDTAEYLRELPKTTPFLRPDVSEGEGEGIIKRGGMGAIESAPMTGAVFAGAAGGAKLGALVTAPFPAAVPAGTVIGGFLGAGATMLGLFGAGTYGKRKDEVTKELSETKPELSNEQISEMAHTNAMSHAKAEILGEGVGDFAAYLIFSRIPGGKIAYKGGKAVLKDLVAPNATKLIAKGIAKDMPFEVGSEVWTAYTQHKADEKIGIERGTALENMGEAIIPAMFLSGGMGVGLGGYNAYQRKSVYNAINSKNPEERVNAINLVSEQIARTTGEKEVAQKWHKAAMQYVEGSRDVPVDTGFSEFIAEEENHKKGIKFETIEEGESEVLLDKFRKGSVEDLISLRQSPEGAEYAKELDQVIGEKGIAEERGLIPREEVGPRALPPGQGFDLLPPKPEVRLRPGPEKIKGPTYPEGAEYVAGKKAPEELEVEHKPVLTIKEKPFKKKENALRALKSKRLASKGITPETHEVIPVEGGFGIIRKVEPTKETKLKEVSKKIKAETPTMLKESDKVNDVTLGTLVDMAAEDPAKALEHAAEATVSKAKLIEGLKNKGLKAMGEAKSKEERAEIKKNLEETLRGIEEGKVEKAEVKLPWEGKQGWEMTKSEIAEKYAFTGEVYDHEGAIKQALKSDKLTPEKYAELHAKDYGPLEKLMPEITEIVKRALKDNVVDIDQLSLSETKALNYAVENGILEKARGGSYPVLHTVYAKPGYDFKGEREKALEKLKKPVPKLEKEPLSETKARLLANIKSEKGSSELINDLSRLGADAIKRGHTSLKAFSAEMKTVLGNAWAKVKHLIKRAYRQAKILLANERGLIGGVKAKGVPTGQLAKAQEMLTEGKDKNDVWRETGWMKGAEKGNVWKFEIDDSDARIKSAFKDDIESSLRGYQAKHDRAATLEEVINHPKIFKAYPELKNITVGRQSELGGHYAPGAIFLGSKSDLTTLLHEIQHAIQEIEGFARGGRPEQFITKHGILKSATRGQVAIFFGLEPSGKVYLKEGGTITKDKIDLVDSQEQLFFRESPGSQYQRLAGEIEAREVEIRKNLTKEQRRIMPPYIGAGGIPQDQWIVIDGKGTSFSVEVPSEGKKEHPTLTPGAQKLLGELEELKKEHEPSSLLPEGVESHGFGETLEPVTTEDYTANRKESKDIKLTARTNARRVVSEMAEGVDKFLGSISTRLGQVSPKLKAKIRKLDFDINTKYADDVKVIHPLLKKAKKMSSTDFADWDYARKNSDIERISELIDKYSLRKEYKAYREVLDSLRNEGLDVGLAVGQIDEYAPRLLKDSRGFLTAIGKAEEWPIYFRKLQERASELGVSVAKMPSDMKADIISNMILGGWSGLGGIPATKQRKLKKIPAYLNKYYMDSDAALMQHLYSMRKGIEARKFFGKIPKKVAEMRTRLYATQARTRDLSGNLKGKLSKSQNKELVDLRKSIKDSKLNEEQTSKINKRITILENIAANKMSDGQTAQIRKRRNKSIGLEKQYTAYIAKYALQRDYTENIGSYVMELINNKEINPQHERVVNEILNARFHEAGTRGLIQAYKNLSYIDTMGSPISALTQIGDLAWAIYEGGFVRAGKHAIKAAIGRPRITKEDVGVTRIAQEFADSGTLGDAVTKVFKVVGLEKIDSIGKESLLNSALEVYQKQAKDNPAKLKKRIRPIFEAETDSVVEDLVNDEISENVKLLVYSRLLDFQPVGLSEMPQRYLDAGNGRLFYMLKTFTLKVFDVFRNESYNKIKDGNKAEKIQGIKNLVRLSMIFVLCNAGADELKDWVLGRKTDFSDRMVDNLLRLVGISKFVTWKARTEGVGSALARQILPPFKFIDSVGKDIITAGDEKGLEVIGSIPVVGKLAYWHIGRGVSKRSDLWDRRLRKRKAKLNKIKDRYEKTKNKTGFIQKHRKELGELRAINKLQGQLNKYRARINGLKSLAESPKRKKVIQNLENERTELIKTFLKRTEKREITREVSP